MSEKKMNKTYVNVIGEIERAIDKEWPSITEAYENCKYDLTLSLKVVLDGESPTIIQVGTVLEYYPEPKRKIKSELITIDEKQMKLPGV